MKTAPGWYYYDGDPAGTVRRWNGNEWIGFPMEPPPDHMGHAAPVFDTHTQPAKPLENQRRLLGFALLASLGLLATIAAAIPAISSLLDAREYELDPNRPRFTNHPMAEQLLGQRVTQVFCGVGLFGGVLFLLWLWRANENIGRSRRRSRDRSNVESQGAIVVIAMVVSPIGLWSLSAVTGVGFGRVLVIGMSTYVLYWLLRPVVRIMFNLIEHSAGGSERGQISPFVGALWWPLWMASTFALVGIAFWARAEFTVTGYTVWSRDSAPLGPSSLLLAVIALAAHIGALLFALRLIWVITKYQDRRLEP